MRLRHLATLIAAPLLAAGLISTPVASATPVDCSTGYAVGGYPKSNLVPGGFTAVPTPGGIFPHENGGYDHGQRVGTANLIDAVDNHAANCGGPINLFGHSYGAAIVHTALETIDTRNYAGRVHVTLTGNPRHPGGIEQTWSWIKLPGFTMRGPGIRPQNLGSFSDRCNPRDAICDMPGNVIGDIDHWIGYAFQGTHRYGS